MITYSRSVQNLDGVTVHVFKEDGNPVILESRMSTITPAFAEAALSRNPRNRRIEPNRVRAWAKMMSEGKWRPVSAIIFDDNGCLVDGQHRLSACVLSGSSITCEVLSGVPRGWIVDIDAGRGRRFADYARFLERDERAADLAIAKVLEYGVNNFQAFSRLTVEDQFALVDKYQEAVRFAVSKGGHTRGMNSLVLSAIARACYTKDRDRLVRFCEVLRTGLTDTKSDYAAIRFRNWLLAPGTDRGRSFEGREEVYRRSLLAIDAFLRRVQFAAKAKATIEDLHQVFPIPEGVRER